MPERRDKLGRRIPEFDRSAASKKGAITQKEKNGPDFHKRIGAVGGRVRKRGHFGTLKDEGKTDELQAIARRGTTRGYFGTLKDQGKTEEIKALAAKGGKAGKRTKRLQDEVRGPGTPVPAKAKKDSGPRGVSER
jgi:hypothetical protein